MKTEEPEEFITKFEGALIVTVGFVLSMFIATDVDAGDDAPEALVISAAAIVNETVPFPVQFEMSTIAVTVVPLVTTGLLHVTPPVAVYEISPATRAGDELLFV